ncbi:MAG: hypothetical protein RL514_2782 [Verrucomicrobiota bacterium]
MLLLAAEGGKWVAEANVVLTEGRSENSLSLVWPALMGFTNELSTAADFHALVGALPKHDCAVIRIEAMGYDANRVTNAASLLRQSGFLSVRVVILRWGQNWPSPTL